MKFNLTNPKKSLDTTMKVKEHREKREELKKCESNWKEKRNIQGNRRRRDRIGKEERERRIKRHP